MLADIDFIIQPVARLANNSVVERVVTELRSGEWTHLQAAIAFASRSGSCPELLNSLSEFLGQGGSVELTFGADGGTDYETVATVLQTFRGYDEAMVFLYHDRDRLFHPKLWMFSNANHALLLVGSSNWSKGGFWNHVEANVAIRLDLNDPAHREAHDNLITFPLRDRRECVQRVTEDNIKSFEGFLRGAGNSDRVSDGDSLGVVENDDVFPKISNPLRIEPPFQEAEGTSPESFAEVKDSSEPEESIGHGMSDDARQTIRGIPVPYSADHCKRIEVLLETSTKNDGFKGDSKHGWLPLETKICFAAAKTWPQTQEHNRSKIRRQFNSKEEMIAFFDSVEWQYYQVAHELEIHVLSAHDLLKRTERDCHLKAHTARYKSRKGRFNKGPVSTFGPVDE